jgi:hypothetical protein
VPCLFKTALNVGCPSCGLTTSLTYLAHGNITKAFQAHPLGLLLALSLIVIIILSIRGLVTNRPCWSFLEKRWFHNSVLCGIGLYLGIWVVRLLI